jgi:hypothetical protein
MDCGAQFILGSNVAQAATILSNASPGEIIQVLGVNERVRQEWQDGMLITNHRDFPLDKAEGNPIAKAIALIEWEHLISNAPLFGEYGLHTRDGSKAVIGLNPRPGAPDMDLLVKYAEQYCSRYLAANLHLAAAQLHRAESAESFEGNNEGSVLNPQHDELSFMIDDLRELLMPEGKADLVAMGLFYGYGYQFYPGKTKPSYCGGNYYQDDYVQTKVGRLILG